jgi:hypothetical protein
MQPVFEEERKGLLNGELRWQLRFNPFVKTPFFPAIRNCG